VRTGSLDQEIDTSGHDELSQLASTFQEMVQRLRVIPVAASEVADAVKDLTQLIADQTEAVQRQSSGLAQVTATMQEIRQTSSTASDSAETVIEVAKRAEAASGAGQGAVESSLQSLEEIRIQIDGIVAKVTDLAERTLLVGGIIETVKDLADHSNMLALNASIEAVKAGELGKGFGVVASEIRSLADQSIQATASIREVLTEIQGAIRSTVSMADRGKKDMDRSMQQIRSSGHSLAELSGVVTQTSQSARQIAASVRQQNIGITQIAGTLEELNVAMQCTTEGINGAKAAAARLTKLANRVDETLRPAATGADASSGEPAVVSEDPPA
jgi:methyl-accepting chemotaxis protein